MMCARWVSAVRTEMKSLLRDLLVRVPEREQPQDLTLAVRERVLVGALLGVGVGREQSRAELGAHVAAALRHLTDGRDYLGVGGLLEHVPGRPGGERLANVARVVLHGEQEHLHVGALVDESRQSLEPGLVRHHDIHQHHVRLERAGLEDRLAPGSRLADRLDVGLPAEQEPDPGAYDGVVIDDQDADRVCHSRDVSEGRGRRDQ